MENHAEEFRQLSLNISYYRKLRELSQEQLAEIVGVSHNHMSQIEAPGITRAFSMKVLFANRSATF